MLIKYPVDPNSSFDETNELKDLTIDEAKSEVKKAVLNALVSQYIEREAMIASNMNIINVIIWGQCTPGLQLE